MPAFVASIPPRFAPRRDGAAPCLPNALATPVIDAANALIEERADPRWFVDFHRGFRCLEHFATDGVHLNAAGQAERAGRARASLFR
jgi:lysophospholipase L1-like esterase